MTVRLSCRIDPDETSLYGSGMFRTHLLFPVLRRFVYLVRRGAGRNDEFDISINLDISE